MLFLLTNKEKMWKTQRNLSFSHNNSLLKTLEMNYSMNIEMEII